MTTKPTDAFRLFLSGSLILEDKTELPFYGLVITIQCCSMSLSLVGDYGGSDSSSEESVEEEEEEKPKEEESNRPNNKVPPDDVVTLVHTLYIRNFPCPWVRTAYNSLN